MAVTSHTRARSSSRSRTSANTQKPWFALALAGLAGVVVLLMILSALRGGGDAAIAKDAGPQVTGAGAYAATNAGAVAAATAFEKYFLLADLEDPQEAKDKVLGATSASYQVKMEQQLDELLEGQGASPLYQAKEDGTKYVARVIPLSYKVASFSPESATVRIWSATLSGIYEVAPPRVAYVRDEIQLTREGGKWLVAGYEELPALVPYMSAAQKTSSEHTFYNESQGGELYEQAP